MARAALRFSVNQSSSFYFAFYDFFLADAPGNRSSIEAGHANGEAISVA
jgi:hypothetical protein